MKRNNGVKYKVVLAYFVLKYHRLMPLDLDFMVIVLGIVCKIRVNQFRNCFITMFYRIIVKKEKLVMMVKLRFILLGFWSRIIWKTNLQGELYCFKEIFLMRERLYRLMRNDLDRAFL